MHVNAAKTRMDISSQWYHRNERYSQKVWFNMQTKRITGCYHFFMAQYFFFISLPNRISKYADIVVIFQTLFSRQQRIVAYKAGHVCRFRHIG